MKRKRMTLVVLSVIILLVPIFVSGCAEDWFGPYTPADIGDLNYDLQITVWDQNRNPVYGATVYATAQGWTTNSITNENGFVLMAVPERAREITVYAQYGTIQSRSYDFYLERGMNEYDIWM